MADQLYLIECHAVLYLHSELFKSRVRQSASKSSYLISEDISVGSKYVTTCPH